MEIFEKTQVGKINPQELLNNDQLLEVFLTLQHTLNNHVPEQLYDNYHQNTAIGPLDTINNPIKRKFVSTLINIYPKIYEIYANGDTYNINSAAAVGKAILSVLEPIAPVAGVNPEQIIKISYEDLFNPDTRIRLMAQLKVEIGLFGFFDTACVDGFHPSSCVPDTILAVVEKIIEKTLTKTDHNQLLSEISTINNTYKVTGYKMYPHDTSLTQWKKLIDNSKTVLDLFTQLCLSLKCSLDNSQHILESVLHGHKESVKQMILAHRNQEPNNILFKKDNLGDYSTAVRIVFRTFLGLRNYSHEKATNRDLETIGACIEELVRVLNDVEEFVNLDQKGVDMRNRLLPHIITQSQQNYGVIAIPPSDTIFLIENKRDIAGIDKMYLTPIHSLSDLPPNSSIIYSSQIDELAEQTWQFVENYYLGQVVNNLPSALEHIADPNDKMAVYQIIENLSFMYHHLLNRQNPELVHRFNKAKQQILQ